MDDKKIKIDVEGEEFDYDPASNASILAFLESKNIPMKSMCRDGFCGACRCKLEKGDVEESPDAIGYKEEDEFLPCASKPKSNIRIKRI
jgi:ferredoxin